MRAIRFICLLSLCWMLSGCAVDSSQIRMATDYAATVKKVGVMSLIDPHANISFLRSSALESNFARASLPNWNVDTLVHDALQGRLKRKGYEVVKVVPDERVRAVYGADWGFPASEPLHEAVYDLGSSLGLDMMVVVARQVDADVVTGTNQNIRGYGLQKAFDTGPFAYAVVFVEAIDVRKRFAVGQAAGEQHIAIAENLWQSEFETAKGVVAIRASNQATIYETLHKLLTAAIGVAVQEAGL
jgi:hypothetical protein